MARNPAPEGSPEFQPIEVEIPTREDFQPIEIDIAGRSASPVSPDPVPETTPNAGEKE